VRIRLPFTAFLLAALLLSAAPVRAEPAEFVLYLVGDAGTKVSASSVVLRPLALAASRDGASGAVAILGDNLYPSGLPAPGAADRAEMERRLLDEIAVAAAGGQGLVVPGNHDWSQSGEDGWNAIRREAEFVAAHGTSNVRFVPEGGCPGPVVLDVSPAVRLVILDSHWFLHGFGKPVGPSSRCPEKSEDDVVAALRDALRPAAGRRTVVLAHHPLESGGRSGSHFGWRDHLFPLTHLKSWLWFPLPVVGTLGVGGRIVFSSPQQMVSPGYRHFKETMARAFDPAPPFLWASGHDHSLQVIRGAGGGPKWNLVSGAGGGFGHVTPADPVAGTLFAKSLPGYMRLAFGKDGRVRLTVVGIRSAGKPEVLFAADLD
jgi:hypothetical protein